MNLLEEIKRIKDACVPMSPQMTIVISGDYINLGPVTCLTRTAGNDLITETCTRQLHSHINIDGTISVEYSYDPYSACVDEIRRDICSWLIEHIDSPNPKITLTYRFWLRKLESTKQEPYQSMANDAFTLITYVHSLKRIDTATATNLVKMFAALKTKYEKQGITL